MKQSTLWFLRPLLILLGALAFLLLFVVPMATSYMLRSMEQPPPFLLRNLGAIEWLQTIAVQVITIAMFFFVGACFASFLNVVAWRVPRGRSILGNSACPRCGHRLSFRDNFPVLGWIRNNGQCAHCGAPISIRYLVVECALGTIVLGIVLLTIAGGGMSLPVRSPDSALGFERILFEARWDLIEIAAGQVLLVFALFTFGLVESEGCRVPIRLVAWFGFFLLIASALAPEIHLFRVDWPFTVQWPMQRHGVWHILSLLAGAIAGSIAGWLLDRWRPAEDCLDSIESSGQSGAGRGKSPDVESLAPESLAPESLAPSSQHGDQPTPSAPPARDGSPPSHGSGHECPTHPGRWVWGLALAGTVLGWQSVPLVALYAAVTQTLLARSRVDSLGRSPSFMLLAGVLIHLVTWRWMNVLGYWIGGA